MPFFSSLAFYFVCFFAAKVQIVISFIIYFEVYSHKLTFLPSMPFQFNKNMNIHCILTQHHTHTTMARHLDNPMHIRREHTWTKYTFLLSGNTIGHKEFSDLTPLSAGHHVAVPYNVTVAK